MNMRINYFCYFVILLTATANCFSQAPAIEWENTIGANSFDGYASARQTADGGYIIGGISQSNISADKTENNIGGNDFWILKLNASGVIEWQNTIGGVNNDYPGMAIPTADGGYIVAGQSSSGISGDKTQNSFGLNDLWLIKLNASGELIWQRDVGGSSDEFFSTILQTSDNGFLLAGYSLSGISGNKNEANQGGADYWVVKFNSGGIPQWQQDIGGSADDILNSVVESPDGGFLLGGTSYSGISGDKTEASVGVGYPDYWVVKINGTGTIEWQNTIGGNLSDNLTSVDLTLDGGYILAGCSGSGISGDKTEASLYSQSPWILKLNSAGNIVWQNTINDYYMFYSCIAKHTIDGGYLIGGIFTNYRLIKLDSDGNISWTTVYGSSCNLRDLEQTSDGGFIIGGESYDGITGDKSEPNYGSADYWIVKTNPEGCVPATETCNAMDDNCNGLIDDGVVETISISAGGPTTFCQGGSTMLTASYSGTSVQWEKDGVNIPGAVSPTYAATAKASYTCTTTSACDSATSTGIYINVQKNPTALITAGGPTIFCPGGSVTLTETPSPGCTYQWYKGASAIAGAITNIYIATESGNYKCLVTKAATGCSKNSNKIVVVVSCREDEINNKQFSIYPNPASDLLTVFSPQCSDRSADAFIIITDLSGKMIFKNDLMSPETIINVSNFAAGIYFVKMMINGNTITKKLIIEH